MPDSEKHKYTDPLAPLRAEERAKRRQWAIEAERARTPEIQLVSYTAPVPQFDCLHGCKNSRFDTEKQFLEWLKTDAVGQIVFTIIDGANKGNIDEIDGNINIKDLRAAATGRNIDQMIDSVLANICTENAAACTALHESKHAIKSLVGDIGRHYQTNDDAIETIDYERTFLERHAWVGTLLTVTTVALALATFVTPCAMACALGAAALSTVSAVDACSGGGDHGTQCGIAVTSAALSWTGVGALASGSALRAGAVAADRAAAARLGAQSERLFTIGGHDVMVRPLVQNHLTGPALAKTAGYLSSAGSFAQTTANVTTGAGIGIDAGNYGYNRVR